MKYIMQNSDSNYRQVIDTIINNRKKENSFEAYFISIKIITNCI